MNTIEDLIHRVLDDAIALYPEPKDASTLVGEKAPPRLPAPTLVVPRTTAANTKCVTTMDPDQIRRRLALDDARLRSATWSDAQLRAINREELAGLAFDTSDSLKTEFHGRKSTFLAYWGSLRGA